MSTQLNRRRRGRRWRSVVVSEVGWDDEARRGRRLLSEAFDWNRRFAQNAAVEGRRSSLKEALHLSARAQRGPSTTGTSKRVALGE
jgi:hypothetical protein